MGFNSNSSSTEETAVARSALPVQPEILSLMLRKSLFLNAGAEETFPVLRAFFSYALRNAPVVARGPMEEPLLQSNTRSQEHAKYFRDPGSHNEHFAHAILGALRKTLSNSSTNSR